MLAPWQAPRSACSAVGPLIMACMYAQAVQKCRYAGNPGLLNCMQLCMQLGSQNGPQKGTWATNANEMASQPPHLGNFGGGPQTPEIFGITRNPNQMHAIDPFLMRSCATLSVCTGLRAQVQDKAPACIHAQGLHACMHECHRSRMYASMHACMHASGAALHPPALSNAQLPSP